MVADQGAISLEEFKARLPLVEVVARHVRLARRGREHLGLCPFHSEKTPSFTVSEVKGFYHCFGCGQHGNAIDFIMGIEGLDFGQAIARLAELTGVPAPRRVGNAEPRVDRTLYAINEATARWLAGRLESSQGAEAAAYLASRGLDREAIVRFDLGYAPGERTALKRALQAEGYEERSAIEAGLLVQPEDGGPSFDRFRHRVMFPIHDRRGRVVGFGGRALGDARAKYLNTPDTALFHKGKLLYGLALARQAIRERGTVLIAEGYMDVIALAQAGFANAVAPLGTAVTEAQLAQLWQLAEEPVVCLDGDEAGLRAAHRMVERALPLLQPGKSLRFALLPPGQDPDSVLRRRGRGFLGKVIEEAIPLDELLWTREIASRSVHVPQHRSALEKRFRELAATIPDRNLSRLFLGAFFRRLHLALGRTDPRARTRPPHLAGGVGPGVGARRLAALVAKPELADARQLFGPILVHPELLHDVEEELASLEFAEPELDSLHQAILCWYGESGHLDPGGLSDHLCETGFTGLVSQLVAPGPRTAWFCQDGIAHAVVLEGWRERASQHRRFAERRAIARAASAALAERRAEAGAHMLAVNRLINPVDPAGGSPRAPRDPME
ncbi:MAG TPA: DNA primase [Geminicoccaceae bacterium]|nr:DNA primase [Geminicoccaceae bacterium]